MSVPSWSILLVDDEPAFRKTLCKSLAVAGHTVEEASSGGEAVDKLANSSFQFVLLDLNMPGMCGLTTCSVIRSIAPRLGIIILSVRETEQDRMPALTAGGYDFPTKPFGLRELIARLTAIPRRIQTEPEKE